MSSLIQVQIIFDFALTHALSHSYCNLTQRHVHVHAPERDDCTAAQAGSRHPGGVPSGVPSRLVHPAACRAAPVSVGSLLACAAPSCWWSIKTQARLRGAFHFWTACQHHLDRLLFRHILQCPVQELRHEAQAASVVEEVSKKYGVINFGARSR